jgi:DNA-binding phage protein
MQKILTEKNVVQLLREEVAKVGGQTGWHRKTAISRVTINSVLRNRTQPTKKIIKALNLETIYRLKKKAPTRSQGKKRGLVRRACAIEMQKILREKDVLQLLRREVAKAGGQSGWARKNGISQSMINKVLREKRPLTKRIIEALGLEIVYQQTQK